MVVHDGHFGPKEIGVQPEFLNWLTDPVLNGGGALTDFGCYGANLMTWLMKGEAPISVTALIQQLKDDPAYAKVDDETTIIVEYEQAQGIIQASWNWPYHRKDMEIYGDAGYVIAPNRNSIRYSEKNKTPEPDREAPALDPSKADVFSYLKGVVRGTIEVADHEPSSLENNMMVTRILDAARQSALTGRRVLLNPN
jgi:predicted dehydrogenase